MPPSSTRKSVGRTDKNRLEGSQPSTPSTTPSATTSTSGSNLSTSRKRPRAASPHKPKKAHKKPDSKVFKRPETPPQESSPEQSSEEEEEEVDEPTPRKKGKKAVEKEVDPDGMEVDDETSSSASSVSIFTGERSLQKSIHAPTTSTAQLPPLLTSKLTITTETKASSSGIPALRNFDMLEERLQLRDSERQANVQANPWVFAQTTGTGTWPSPILLDPHAPYRYSKPQPPWLNRMKEPGVLWAIAYGRAESAAKVAVLRDGAKACLAQNPKLAGTEVTEIGTTNGWSLLKLNTKEQAWFITNQKVILHQQLNTALFYFPVMTFFMPVQSIFINVSKSSNTINTALAQNRAAAILSLRRSIARFLKLPEEYVEEAEFFLRKNNVDQKVGFRVYLADPALCEDLSLLLENQEVQDRMLSWKELWRKSGTVVVPGEIDVAIHILAPCGWCHSGDHGESLCPWSALNPFGRQLVVIKEERDLIRPEDSVSGQVSAASSAAGI